MTVLLDSIYVQVRGLLLGIITLRWHQFRWVVGEWAWVFGLKPSSGKWSERLTFLYIYILIIGILTPSALQTVAGLYAAEAQTAPGLQFLILQQTIPWMIAIIGLMLIVVPWKAWMLRLTFGDITYLAPSPIDRRVLALWRYLELVVVIPLLTLLPATLIAPIFGSVWAQDVIPTVARTALVTGLWCAPVMALGWHISLRRYTVDSVTPSIVLITRLAIIVLAGAIAYLKPDILLWPGRLLVLVVMGRAGWAWPLLMGYLPIGVVVVWRAAGDLSLTRASAGSEVFARIQQFGIMIFLDLRLLPSILSEANAKQTRAIGTLPSWNGLATFMARATLHYYRRPAQALQLVLTGMLFSITLILWHPTNLLLLAITALLLAWQIPPSLARLFRQDQSVPFVAQLIPQPLTRRLLVTNVVPVALALAGMLPWLLAFSSLMPQWVWGLVPVIWVLSLFGHAEVIGKGSTPGKRDIFSLILGGLAVFAVMWLVTSNRMDGMIALGVGLLGSFGMSFLLVTFAEIRHHDFDF